MNLPDYNFLPAPLWLITALHIVTLTLHFVAMNFVFGGLVAVLFGKLNNRWEHPAVQRMIRLFPSAMAATVTLGVAPLLFLQLAYHRQAYSAAIVSGWFWLFIAVAVIISYYFLYGASFGKASGGRKGWYLGIALAGMAYVSFIYSSVFSLAERPELYHEVYASIQSGLALNPDVGSYIFRWLHMITGAITVGGFLFGWISRDHDDAYRVGKAFFLWGMAAAALFGFVYLVTLGDDLLAFMRTPAIWILTLGIILSAGSLHFYFKKRFAPATVMVFVSMITMVISRHYVRLIRLQEHFELSTLPVRPQWGIFIIFLIFFVIAIALVWYMMKLFFAETKEAKA